VLGRLGLSFWAGADLVAVDPDAIGCWSLGADLSGVLESRADGASAAQLGLVGS